MKPQPLFIVAETSPVTRGEEPTLLTTPLPYKEASDICYRLNLERSEGERFEIIEADEPEALLESAADTLNAADRLVNAIESEVICEFSPEDNTPTLHLTLWRGFTLNDLPDTGLRIIAEGFSDIGPTYSLQP